MDKLDFSNQKAYAKINLDLYITGLRADVYHELYSHMHAINLYDDVFVERTDGDIILEISDPSLPTGKENTAFKAATFIKDYFDLKCGYKITINKRIPCAAGLGGSSADAAAVIRAIGEMEGIDYIGERANTVSAMVGADVPFMIRGYSALCRGIGERISSTPLLPQCNILLAIPPFGISTAWAYKEFDRISKAKEPKEYLHEAILNNDLEGVCKNLYNDLEFVAIKEYPIIEELKNTMMECHALGSIMSGSGSCVYGIFDSLELLESCMEEIQKRFSEVTLIGTEGVL